MSTSLPGKIGPYRLGARLGQGGMGEVFRGWDERLDRHVALKRIKPGDEIAKLRQRFRREAKAVARASHPAIVEIFDWVETDHGDWIIMELVEGRSLRQMLKQGPLTPRHAVGIALDIAQGLAAAHKAGLVHRDLKPSNIMVMEADGADSSQAKILDFGLAKMVDKQSGDETVLSETGRIVGTIPAMSPEQAMGLPLDARSDLFALGSLLYELLTGLSPFQADSMAATAHRICSWQQKSAHEQNPGVPETLSKLVDRLLEKNMDLRPQSAHEVAANLEHLLAHDFATLPTGSTYLEQGSTLLPFHAAPSNSTPSNSSTALRTLLLSDLVGSTRLLETLGDQCAAKLIATHDRLARDLLVQHGGLEIDKSDGFLMLFERPLSAVLYAVAYHQVLRDLSAQEGFEIVARIGVHLGEVVLSKNSASDVARGAKPVEVEGLAKPMAARLRSLAMGGQTLISWAVRDLGQRSAVGHSASPTDLVWLEHGLYRLQGVEQPVEVFEVGVPGQAPLQPPPDSAKARRAGRRRGRKFAWAAAAALTAAVLGGVAWKEPAMKPLAVAVLAPEVTSVDDSVDAGLVASVLRGALEHTLLQLEAVSLPSSDQVDLVEGTPVEVARALAADEIITAGFACASQICQISLSRVAAGSGDTLWGANFTAQAGDLLILRSAVVQHLRRGYTERRTKAGASDLEVRAQDYESFLRLRRGYLEREPGHSAEDTLRELHKLHETSPRFIDSYLFETYVASIRFYNTRDHAFLDAALTAYRSAHEIDPQDPRPLLGLANLALDAEDPALLEKALGELDKLAASHPKVVARRARLLERRGEPERALAILRQVATSFPSWSMLRDLAKMEYRQGFMAAAREHLEQAILLAPKDFLLQADLAQIELLSGDPHRAVELYENLVQTSPELGSLVNLGVSYFLVERYQEAAEVLRRATEQVPGNPALLLNLADAELLLGNEATAMARYREVLTILSKDPFAATAQGLTVRAQALAHLGEFGAAVAAAQDALQMAPDDPNVALEVAIVHALAGEKTSALAYIERALQGGFSTSWLCFPWFDSVRETRRFRELVGIVR